MKPFLLVCCIFTAMGFGLSFLLMGNGDWSRNAVPSEGVHLLNWYTPELTNDEEKVLTGILSQRFHYLEEGGQSYVFISEDKSVVLKLFKFHRFEPQWYIAYLPNLPFIAQIKEEHIAKRGKRLKKAFEGHKIAYENIRMANGLIYLQLIPDKRERNVVIVDKDGDQRLFNLGETAFAVQKIGEPLNIVLARLLDQGNVDEMLSKVDSIIELYLNDYKQGIFDQDHGVMHNLGFSGNKPMHLDLGEIMQDERMKEKSIYLQDLNKVTQKILSWVEKYYPQYFQDTARHIETELHNL